MDLAKSRQLLACVQREFERSVGSGQAQEGMAELLNRALTTSLDGSAQIVQRRWVHAWLQSPAERRASLKRVSEAVSEAFAQLSRAGELHSFSAALRAKLMRHLQQTGADRSQWTDQGSIDDKSQLMSDELTKAIEERRLRVEEAKREAAREAVIVLPESKPMPALNIETLQLLLGDNKDSDEQAERYRRAFLTRADLRADDYTQRNNAVKQSLDWDRKLEAELFPKQDRINASERLERLDMQAHSLASHLRSQERSLLRLRLDGGQDPWRAFVEALQTLPQAAHDKLPKRVRELLPEGQFSNPDRLVENIVHETLSSVRERFPGGNKHLDAAMRALLSGDEHQFRQQSQHKELSVLEKHLELLWKIRLVDIVAAPSQAGLRDLSQALAPELLGSTVISPLQPYAKGASLFGAVGPYVCTEGARNATWQGLEDALIGMVKRSSQPARDAMDAAVRQLAKDGSKLVSPELFEFMGMPSLVQSGELWLDFEKQTDGRLQLTIYAPDSLAEQLPGGLPLCIRNIDPAVFEPEIRESEHEQARPCPLVKRMLELHLGARLDQPLSPDARSFFDGILPLLGGDIEWQKQNKGPLGIEADDFAAMRMAHALEDPSQARLALARLHANALIDFCRPYVDVDSKSIKIDDPEIVDGLIGALCQVRAELAQLAPMQQSLCHEEQDVLDQLWLGLGQASRLQVSKLDELPGLLNMQAVGLRGLRTVQDLLTWLVGDRYDAQFAGIEGIDEVEPLSIGEFVQQQKPGCWYRKLVEAYTWQTLLSVIAAVRLFYQAQYKLELSPQTVLSLLYVHGRRFLPKPLQEWIGRVEAALLRMLVQQSLNLLWWAAQHCEQGRDLRATLKDWDQKLQLALSRMGGSETPELTLNPKLVNRASLEAERVTIQRGAHALPHSGEKGPVDSHQQLSVRYVWRAWHENASKPIHWSRGELKKQLEELHSRCQERGPGRFNTLSTCMELLESLPLPHSEEGKRLWTERTAQEARALLESVTDISQALQGLYAAEFQRSYGQASTNDRYALIQYSQLAISDCLARQDPAAKLSGFQIKPMELALIYHSRRRRDSQYTNQPALHSEAYWTRLRGLCGYLKVPLNAKLSMGHIQKISKNQLFSYLHLGSRYQDGGVAWTSKIRELDYIQALVRDPERQKQIAAMPGLQQMSAAEQFQHIAWHETLYLREENPIVPRSYSLLKLQALLSQDAWSRSPTQRDYKTTASSGNHYDIQEEFSSGRFLKNAELSLLRKRTELNPEWDDYYRYSDRRWRAPSFTPQDYQWPLASTALLQKAKRHDPCARVVFLVEQLETVECTEISSQDQVHNLMKLVCELSASYEQVEQDAIMEANLELGRRYRAVMRHCNQLLSNYAGNAVKLKSVDELSRTDPIPASQSAALMRAIQVASSDQTELVNAWRCHFKDLQRQDERSLAERYQREPAKDVFEKGARLISQVVEAVQSFADELNYPDRSWSSRDPAVVKRRWTALEESVHQSLGTQSADEGLERLKARGLTERVIHSKQVASFAGRDNGTANCISRGGLNGLVETAASHLGDALLAPLTLTLGERVSFPQNYLSGLTPLNFVSRDQHRGVERLYLNDELSDLVDREDLMESTEQAQLHYGVADLGEKRFSEHSQLSPITYREALSEAPLSLARALGLLRQSPSESVSILRHILCDSTLLEAQLRQQPHFIESLREVLERLEREIDSEDALALMRLAQVEQRIWAAARKAVGSTAKQLPCPLTLLNQHAQQFCVEKSRSKRLAYMLLRVQLLEDKDALDLEDVTDLFELQHLLRTEQLVASTHDEWLEGIHARTRLLGKHQELIERHETQADLAIEHARSLTLRAGLPLFDDMPLKQNKPGTGVWSFGPYTVDFCSGIFGIQNGEQSPAALKSRILALLEGFEATKHVSQLRSQAAASYVSLDGSVTVDLRDQDFCRVCVKQDGRLYELLPDGALLELSLGPRQHYLAAGSNTENGAQLIEARGDDYVVIDKAQAPHELEAGTVAEHSGLSLLSRIAPADRLKVFAQPDGTLKRIEGKQIAFTIDAATGRLCAPALTPGYTVARKQAHPAVASIPSCLLMENDKGNKQVILSRGQWIYAASARVTSQLGPLRELVKQALEIKAANDNEAYSVFSLRADGQLDSSNAEDLLDLVYIYLAAGEELRAEQAAARIQELLRRQEPNAQLLDRLEQTLFTITVAPIPHEPLTRIRLALVASIEQARQLDRSQQPDGNLAEPSPTAADVLKEWMPCMVILNDLSKQADASTQAAIGPHREWMLYQMMVRRLRRLILRNMNTVDPSIPERLLRAGLEGLGWNNLLESMLRGQARKRFRLLRASYDVDSRSLGSSTLRATRGVLGTLLSGIRQPTDLIQQLNQNPAALLSSWLLDETQGSSEPSRLRRFLKVTAPCISTLPRAKSLESLWESITLGEGGNYEPPMWVNPLDGPLSAKRLHQHFFTYYRIAYGEEGSEKLEQLRDYLKLATGGWDRESAYLVHVLEQLANAKTSLGYPKPEELIQAKQRRSSILRQQACEKIHERVLAACLMSELPNQLETLGKQMLMRQITQPAKQLVIDGVKQRTGYDLQTGRLEADGNAAKQPATSGQIPPTALTRKHKKRQLVEIGQELADAFSSPQLEERRASPRPLSNHPQLDELESAIDTAFDKLFDYAFLSQTRQASIDGLPGAFGDPESLKRPCYRALLKRVNKSCKEHKAQLKQAPGDYYIFGGEAALMDLSIQAHAMHARISNELADARQKILDLVNAGKTQRYGLQQDHLISEDDLDRYFLQGGLHLAADELNVPYDLLEDLDKAWAVLAVKESRFKGQLGRVIGHIDSALEHVAKGTLAENSSCLEALALELKARRHWKASQLDSLMMRSLLIFSKRSGFMLWEKQCERFLKWLGKQDQNTLSEWLMGLGKTTFGLLAAAEIVGQQDGEFPCVIWPAQVAATNVSDSSRMAWDNFHQEVFRFNFNRGQRIDAQTTKALLNLHKYVMEEGQAIHATRWDLAGLELMFLLLTHESEQRGLDASDDEEQAWCALRDMLRHYREHGVCLMDEPHEVLVYYRDLCWPVGEAEPISDQDYRALEKNMQVLLQEPNFAKYLKMNVLSSLPESFDQKSLPAVLRCIAEKALKLKPDEVASFIAYASGELSHKPELFVDHEREAAIDLSRGIFSELLPLVRDKAVGVHFGWAKDIDEKKEDAEQYSKPYSGNQTPRDNSIDKNPYENLVKTFLTMGSTGMRAFQYEKICGRLLAEATQVAQARGCDPRSTRAGQRFKSITGLDPLANADYASTYEQGKRHHMAISLYIRHYVKNSIRYWRHSFRHNHRNFPSMFKRTHATTGTPYSFEMMQNLQLQADPGTIGKAIATITSHCVSDQVEVLETKTAHEALDQVIDSYFSKGSKTRMIVDGGALFRGISHEEVAERLWKHAVIDKNMPDIRAITFYKDGLMMSYEGQGNIKPRSQSQVPKSARLTYFDQIHGFGANEPQVDDAEVIITVGEDDPLFKKCQEGYRARGIKKLLSLLGAEESKQQLRFVTTAQIKTTIKPEGALSMREQWLHSFRQEAKLLEKGNVRSLMDDYDNVLRNRFMQHLLDCNGLFAAHECYRNGKGIVLSEQSSNPTKLFGLKRRTVTPEQAIQRKKDAVLARVDKHGRLFSATERTSISQQLDALPVPTLPNEITVWDDPYGKPVEQAADFGGEMTVEVETENEAETENENENENEHQNENERQMQGGMFKLPFQEWSWDPSSDYLSDAWIEELKAHPSEGKGFCPVLPLSQAAEKSRVCGLKDLGGLLDKRLWVTNNFLPTHTKQFLEQTAELGSHEQRRLYEVVVYMQDGKISSVGALSLKDSSFLRSAVDRDKPRKSGQQAFIYDCRLHAVVAGDHIPKEELRANTDLQGLINQLKFLNGDEDYEFGSKQLEAWVKGSVLHEEPARFKIFRLARNGIEAQRKVRLSQYSVLQSLFQRFDKEEDDPILPTEDPSPLAGGALKKH